jgi:drug/metabolite transporter (DMT)-like permease
MKSKRAIGITSALLAGITWGTASPVAKLIVAGGVSLMSAMVIRTFLVSAVMGIWIICKKREDLAKTRSRTYLFFFISSMLAIVCSNTGFQMSLETLSVAQALIIHYTFPLVTLAGSLWVARERPAKLEVFAGFLIVAGVYLGMGAGERAFAQVPAVGLIWGVLSVFGLSGQSLYVRRYSKSEDIDQFLLLFFVHFFGFFALFTIKSFFMGWADLANLDLKVSWYIFIQFLFGSILPYGFFYTALKYIPAATVSLLCTLEMVVAVLLAAVLIGAMPSMLEILGCTLILAAVFMASARKSP